MKVAQKRAEIKGLTNIKWYYDKLENIPELNLGKLVLKFKYFQKLNMLRQV